MGMGNRDRGRDRDRESGAVGRQPIADSGYRIAETNECIQKGL